ncbi:MAG: hypothetical protein PF518_04240 [Spirochaetaceae bacterium]|jgi:nitroreductase|nr:hypothetical protein [Spirochaetaceae bacterium]
MAYRGSEPVKFIEIINKRISVRTFSTESLDEEILEKIKKIVTKKRKGPFGKTFSFTLIDTQGELSEDVGKMTSYGVIKDARYYFSAYCDGDDRSVYDFGYCFEEAILELTFQELGTCWMGGTFGRGFFSRIMELPEDKIIPAISPVGISLEKRAFADKITRFIAGSKNRKSFQKLFFNYSGDVHLLPVSTEELRAPLNEVLEAVRSAPSASNKQPWRIVIQDNNIHFYWEFDSRYNSMIKGFNIQALDMGIALCHFKKAAEELRLGGNLSYADPHFENVNWKYILSWKVR